MLSKAGDPAGGAHLLADGEKEADGQAEGGGGDQHAGLVAGGAVAETHQGRGGDVRPGQAGRDAEGGPGGSGAAKNAAAQAAGSPLRRGGIAPAVAVGFAEKQKGAALKQQDQITAVATQVGGFELEGKRNQARPIQQRTQMVERIGRGIKQGHGGGAVSFGEPAHQGGEGIGLCRGSSCQGPGSRWECGGRYGSERLQPGVEIGRQRRRVNGLSRALPLRRRGQAGALHHLEAQLDAHRQQRQAGQPAGCGEAGVGAAFQHQPRGVAPHPDQGQLSLQQAEILLELICTRPGVLASWRQGGTGPRRACGGGGAHGGLP